jgi:hypothetical protein
MRPVLVGGDGNRHVEFGRPAVPASRRRSGPSMPEDDDSGLGIGSSVSIMATKMDKMTDRSGADLARIWRRSCRWLAGARSAPSRTACVLPRTCGNKAIPGRMSPRRWG